MESLCKKNRHSLVGFLEEEEEEVVVVVVQKESVSFAVVDYKDVFRGEKKRER